MLFMKKSRGMNFVNLAFRMALLDAHWSLFLQGASNHDNHNITFRIRSQKRTPKPKKRRNSNKELSEQFEGTTQ